MFTKIMFVHVLQINNTLVLMFTRKYFTLVGPGNLVNYTYQSFHLNIAKLSVKALMRPGLTSVNLG